MHIPTFLTLLTTLLLLPRLASAACLRFDGIYQPSTHILVGTLYNNNQEACYFFPTVMSTTGGEGTQHWLGCKPGHYAWAADDLSEIAYATDRVDYRLGLKLYWDGANYIAQATQGC
jgi:hypothetical protein